MYIGGIRALLLQSLHPLAMAGVAGLSGYQDDPWGRLQRTADYVATTTFARKEDVEKMISHVRSIQRNGDTACGKTARSLYYPVQPGSCLGLQTPTNRHK